jgi:hypothetical protein
VSAKPGEPLCSTPFSQVGGCIESSAGLGRYRWTIEGADLTRNEIEDATLTYDDYQ